jgi:hypothetical protein
MVVAAVSAPATAPAAHLYCAHLVCRLHVSRAVEGTCRIVAKHCHEVSKRLQEHREVGRHLWRDDCRSRAHASWPTTAAAG